MKRGITINGQPLSVIEEELRKPIPDEELDETREGFLSIPVETYEKRLDEVIGVLNYDRISQGGEIVEVAGQLVATATTFINIYDDEGNVCLRKSSPGAANIIIIKDTGRPKNVKSDIASATSESFKNCCKLLKIGIEQIRDDRRRKKEEAKKKEKTKNSNVEQSNKTVSPEVLHKVRFQSRLSSGNKFYSAEVIDTKTDENLKLMIFKREIPLIEEYISFDEFTNVYGIGKELSFYGYINEFRGERQIIFNRPSVKEASNGSQGTPG